MNIKQLRKKYEGLVRKGHGLYELAEKETREFTDDEWTELKQLDVDVAEVLGEIEKAEAESELADRLEATFGGPMETRPGMGTLSKFTGNKMRGQTVGTQVISAAEFKSWQQYIAPSGTIPSGGRLPASPTIEVKGFPDFFGRKELVTGGDDQSAGAFIETDVTGIYEALGRFALTLRQLITIQQTTVDRVSFVRQTQQATEAAPVPESNVTEFSGSTGEVSGEKPEGTIKYERVTADVETIAQWVPATNQALADAPQLRGLIDVDLRDDLAEELESQIINGTGLNNNLLGVIATPGVLLQAWDTDILTTARKAITHLLLTGRSIATGWLLNPEDWETIDLETDTTGQFYFGGPLRQGTRTLWGYPVVQCVHVPQGTGILGDWRKAVLWDRQSTTITISNSHADFFIRNMVAIRAEMRAAFGLRRPSAFVMLDLTAGS